MIFVEAEFNRRKFLKILTLGGAAAAVNAVVPSIFSPSKLLPFPSNIYMVDISPGREMVGVMQSHIPNEDDLFKYLLGAKYVSWVDIVGKYGFDLARDNFRQRFLREHPEVAMTHEVLGYYRLHAESVVNAIHGTLGTKGVLTTIQMDSIQDVFTPDDIKFVTDKHGNKGVLLGIEPDPLINLLSQHLKQTVVNYSFQVGTVGFFIRNWARNLNYEGNRTLDVELVTAYQGPEAEKNLQKLFSITSAYPEKLFVVAAGNESEDLRPFREALFDDWPDNILFVAEWDGDWQKRPHGSVRGADIYVDNSRLGLKHGSSFSVPVVSACASYLEQKGLTISEIKQELIRVCKETSFGVYSSQIGRMLPEPALVFNSKEV